METRLLIFLFYFTTILFVSKAFEEQEACFVTGSCTDSIIAIQHDNSEDEFQCRNYCINDDECQWFTFDPDSGTCKLFRHCFSFDEEACLNCITGEKSCFLEDSFEEEDDTTTILPPTSYSKILVATGYNSVYLDDVEVIDLSSSSSTCQKLQNFPYPTYHQSAGLGFEDKPLICGGRFNKTDCHVLEDGVWKLRNSLNLARESFAMTKSPFQDGKSKLFVTGGAQTSMTEVLTQQGWEISVDLPLLLAYHCMVAINSTSVIIIGGYPLTGSSYIYNSESGVLSEGPTLATPRKFHNCGLIQRNGESSDLSVIVVGGYDGRALKFVEVLDPDSSSWRRGPDLPIGIYAAQMVEDPNGGMVLLGGDDGNGNYLNTLYRLGHAGEDAVWEEMPQKLRVGRAYHTALLVPDEVTDCS